MPIKILEPQVVSRIAAGEVVQRPASVVKELVENSLDAGSSQITVEIKDGGTGLIQVVDNGIGIPAGEVALAFDRYATSKINRFEDLSSIHSLGFRGEALPSIAAVAQVDIVTRAKDEEIGSYLTVKDGSASSRDGRGRSPGTTITVRNLFRQVPARLKFLKSRSTENSHIANLVSQYALAFPEVKFLLSIDGRIALRTAGSSRLIDSIAQVYGLEVARNMLEVGDSEDEWESGASVNVTGMIGSPSVSRSGRGYLSFFVNHRWINSRLLAWSVEEAYHGLLLSGKHPIAIINISLPPAEVDINIHPAKTEVKFQNEHQVFGAVQKAVRRTLVEQAPVPSMEEPAASYLSSPVPGNKLWASPENRHGAATSPSAAPQTTAASLPVLRVLGQLSSSYIIAEGPDGLYLIDQHAAHERILFDQIKRQRSMSAIEVQGLLDPVTLEVNPRQEEVLKLHYEDLAEFGFAIEPFGDRAYLVRAVPALIHNKDWVVMVRELLDSVTGENQVDWQEIMAMSMACHGAVKAGQSLTSDEMRELIRQLEEATVPQTCPHGRPTMIHIGAEQLKREFGRS